MDEYFVTSRAQLFTGSKVGDRFGRVRDEIKAKIGRASEDEVLSAEIDQWAKGVADQHQVPAPTVNVEAAEITEHGAVTVNCTNTPGITYTLTEGTVWRPGARLQLTVPGEGELELLASRPPAGGPPFVAELEPTQVVRTWDWPEVKGSDAFNSEVEECKNALERGTEAIALDIERRNGELEAFARSEIDARRAEILKRREFLGGIKMPVRPSPDQPKEFGPPPAVRRPTPARSPSSPDTTPPGPELDEFYEHILDVIRGVARSLERSPGSFADADEEALRDHMLVTLNTHYVGQTYAEAFNRAGKTDILIRVHDRNAFIGECKWWSGPAAFVDALEQLFGYTTWQDSRIALIFYVRNKEITRVVEGAREQLEQHPQFVSWDGTPEDRELRCRVQWPTDPERTATLTALFVHLAPAKE